MPQSQAFNRQIDGKAVQLYQLKNSQQTRLHITNYGCRIVNLVVADKTGSPVDVVVGFDSLDGYLTATEVYHGATIGRYANRIARGRCTVAGKPLELAINNQPNHLHGGPEGFHTKVWEASALSENSITLSYLSADGEEGYPGNLRTEVSFTLSEDNEVIIRYRVQTDQPTVLNLTNHAYFNLNGVGSGTILKHSLQIFAAHYTPVDENLIPTGQLAPVEQTPFDFSTPHTIGERINSDFDQLRFGNGYDHNYVLNTEGRIALAAKATGDASGVVMEVYTDQPGVQFYTGNFMSGENIIKGHVPDHFRTAFCLETQHYPDSPNQSAFPSTQLEPGETFTSTTIYKFLK